MKQCPYCGKEYPDETTVCAIDAQPLVGETGTTEGQKTDAPASAAQPIQLWPDYRWTQRDAWKFIGMMLVFDVVWYFGSTIPYTFIPHFYDWRWGPFGYGTMRIIYAGLSLLTVAYFARTDTFASFWKAVGLDRKPSDYVWFGVAAALVIRLAGHMVLKLGWAKGVSNYGLSAFKHGHGPTRYLFLFPVLFAAFWEEPMMRGFLYKAFRGSHSAPTATLLIVGYTAFTHWNQYGHSGLAVVALSTLTIVQCALREKSDSLWDIILCHLVYNGSSLIIGGYLW